MFYFQQLLNQGLTGIDGTGMIPAVIGIGYTILLIGFLIGIYQAAMRGGDVQSLAVTGIKYLVVAIILANWSTVFHEVNDSFNQIAQFIDKRSGAGDMFLSWMDQLKQQFSNSGSSAILPSISGTMAAMISTLMILTAYLIYAVMVVVFAFFYVLYGCVLYVLGPLILALLPIVGIGQLAKGYGTNVMIWNAWGILYAVFGSLITAIQFNRVDQVMNQGFLQGFFQGTSDSTIIGLVSVFYTLALGLIPFIAHRVISGEVGSSAYSLVRAGAAAAGAVISGVSGFAAGVGAGSETSAAVGAGAGVMSSTPASAMAAAASSSAPPPEPGLAGTIRSGIMSAVNGTAPAAPASDQTGSRQNTGFAAAAAGVGTTRMKSSDGFRPIGVTETLAFHASRYAASALSHGENGRSRSGSQGR